jgi:hypothetical protein
VEATIDYCARLGFNKIRFLLTGYPRDTATATSKDREHGVPDAARRPNYGAHPGRLNPLPAWEGKPHAYDFSRFQVEHWERVDRAVRRMRDRGIVATAIITIEKQNLPVEYGRLTPQEIQLYRYAAARLGAFDNVWFDLGNEHNEFRDPAWGDAMGASLRALEPHGRLISAHGYADFVYSRSPWAGFLITQHYGTPRQLYDWTLQHRGIPKPYVNEEYGYEANQPKPGHLQDAELTRRGHWAISMAGGYASYGDWSDGIAWFYMGVPGPGVAAGQLQHLRRFFESLPFRQFAPMPGVAPDAYCLARPPGLFVFYFPSGGAEVDLSLASREMESRWFDPRNGVWTPGPKLQPRPQHIHPPSGADWALVVQ